MQNFFRYLRFLVFNYECNPMEKRFGIHIIFTGVSHPNPSPTLLKLSSCLSALNPWSSQSQMKLNPTKSEMMFFGTSRLLSKYNLPSVVTLDGTKLPISSKLKILGVTLNSK